jgi:D-alanyl-lipoteichoic acid acyltransferase DltB (MBOAT superfamily)
MLFNSFAYLIFLPIVFLLYWTVKPEKFRRQNILLIIASYIFYGAWDYRFLFLLIFSTSLDYFMGLKIRETDSITRSDTISKRRKFWLLTSLIINLGFLGFFKYCNFFIDSFATLISAFGMNPNLPTLRIILPVGISFYTFHGISYVLDIYNRKIEPTRNIVDYSLFVCFFPLLVAGPIERATHLLPQLKKPRTFSANGITDGLKQILWGLFKKMVIADNCATVVNQIFENYDTMPANTLVLGAILFTVQLYSDFSGYSDIALGSARLFGVELLQNFNYPLFGNSMADYWKRNHISMTTWFMDYVYYPLTAKKDTLAWWNFCMIITFFLSGLWHGANWTFVLWGGIHGALIVISTNSKRSRKKWEKQYRLDNNPLYRLGSILLTVWIVCFVGILFRVRNIAEAGHYVANMCSTSLFSTNIGEFNTGKSSVLMAVVLAALMFFVEWKGQKNPYPIKDLGLKKWQRYSLYYALILVIMLFAGQEQQFVYFQF